MILRTEEPRDYESVYHVIKDAFEVPRENFMACKLHDEALCVSGVVRYASEFGIE